MLIIYRFRGWFDEWWKKNTQQAFDLARSCIHNTLSLSRTHSEEWVSWSACLWVGSICSPVPVFLCLLSLLYGAGACLCCQGKIPLQSSAASDWLTSFSSAPPPATAFLPSPRTVPLSSFPFLSLHYFICYPSTFTFFLLMFLDVFLHRIFVSLF